MINVEEARSITKEKSNGYWRFKAIKVAEKKIRNHAKKGIKAAAIYFKKEYKAIWLRDEIRKYGFEVEAYQMINKRFLVRILWK